MSNLEEIESKLNQLAGFQIQLDVLALKKQDAIGWIISSEQRLRMDEVEREFRLQFSEIEEQADALREIVKREVADAGQSVKGEFLQAVYSPGRVTWCTDSLDGYAEAHQEILKFRKVGSASVAIRGVG